MRIEYSMRLVLRDGRTSCLSVGIQTLLILGVFLLASSVPCRAQAAPANEYLVGSNGANFTAVVSPAFTSKPFAADSTASYPAPAETTSADDEWHFAVSPYLWFPGIHGCPSPKSHPC